MPEDYRYAVVAEEIDQRIRTGLYRTGDRLPGVRRLGAQLGVSVSTVLEALHRLEEQGKVTARPRSGYYVNALPAVPEPATSRPPQEPAPVTGQDLVLGLVQAANDPRFVQLGAAVPHPSFLPRQALTRSLNAVYRLHGDQAMSYAFPPGAPWLREQLARRLTEVGTPLAADDLVITDGCQDAVSLALRAVTVPGDVVAMESPTYYGLIQALEAAGLKALEIPTHPREGISLDALGFALEQWPVKACIVTTNFSNPLGAVMTSERKDALVGLLEEHGVPLIEDDIYGDLPFPARARDAAREGTPGTGVRVCAPVSAGAQRPDTAKSYDRTGNVLYCGSFSKTLSPGLRVGWIAAGRYHRRVEVLKYVANLSAPTANQLAVAHLLERGAYERHLREVRTAYARAVGRMLRALEAAFPAGTCVSRPAGGFLLWVQLPDGTDSLGIHRRARQEGISVAPGPMFSASGKYRDCLRLNAALPWSGRLERAINVLGRLAAGR